MATPLGAPDLRREPVLYVVATVHLDTQWRWTVRDTIRELLPHTLEGNFELFEKFPGYVLSFEGAFRYMLIREYFPRAWERLKGYARAGRWLPAGSMLDSADVNLVSPESLIRHVLHANRFFRRELGTESRDLFLPDCFGFGFGLPSIAAHCGLLGFSSQKFIKYMAPASIPFDLGLWEGPDGAAIVAALNPEGYGDGIEEDLSRAGRWRTRIEALGQRTGVYAGYKYFGTGDRGGAPDQASLVWLERALAEPGPVRLIHDGSDRLFRDLEPEQRQRLPRFKGELLLPDHGTGCFTSQAAMKRWNRKNELLADAAERAAAAADWLGALPYPGELLRRAWIRFLWHQMHDDLTGTSVPAAYRISWNDEALAHNLFATLLADAVGAVARSLDTRCRGIPLAVFNPLSIARCDPVEALVDFPQGAPAALRVFGPEGSEVPSQVVARRGRRLEIVFLAELPPLGLCVFDLREDAAPCALETGLEVGAATLDNGRYRIELNAAGDVSRVLDRQSGGELLSAPIRLQLLPDRSSRWPAWEIRFEDLCAPEPECVGAPARIRICERGPARAALEVTRSARGSSFVQRIRLAPGAAGGRLELDHRVEWRTRGRLLKAAFPLAVAGPVATYDLGLGVIARGTNSREKHEVPAQQWADLSCPEEGRGVSVLEDSKYGWDKPDERTLRLSLLRSPRALRRYRHQAYQDLGPHRFLLALHGHRGGWADGDTTREAARLNQPPLAFRLRPGQPGRGRSFSFAALNDPAVDLRALKRAEEGGELVARLQETRGRAVRALRVDFPAEVVAAREVDGTERPRGPAQVDEGSLTADFGPFGLRSYALRLAPPERPLRPPRFRPLPLPWDRAAASFHGQRRGPDFDGRGHSLPGELLPGTVRVSGLDFELGPRQPRALNCLTCRGQELPLDGGGFERLWLLAAAVRGEARARFRAGGSETELTVPDYSAPIGQWARRPRFLGRPWGRRRQPFLRRRPVAWVGTHRHDARVRDQPYVFCYLFRFVLDLAPDAESIRLPDQPRIRLFAATLADGESDRARPAWPDGLIW